MFIEVEITTTKREENTEGIKRIRVNLWNWRKISQREVS